MKKVFLPALIALACVIPAHAQDAKPESPRRFDIGWSPVSYLRQGGADLWGGSISAAMRRSDHLSYVVDVSIHQTNPPNPATTAAYRFGLRYYLPARRKFTPFGEALVGGAHVGTTVVTNGTTNTVTPGRNGFSFAAGGGVDRAIKSWFSWRVLQVDYSLLHAGGNTSNGVRVHTGGVFHIGPAK